MNHDSPANELASRHQQATAWLLDRINYERSPAMPYRPSELKLDRMRMLLDRLGSPDRGLRIVHVAGTKGKGSTSAMLAAMLQQAGYRTGLYTSPHLNDIGERMAVDGVACPPTDFVALTDQLRPVVEQVDHNASQRGEKGLTFFDCCTALGLLHFAREKCDAVVLEVGLGGRLDSTNVCQPAVAVITSIGIDHTKQLGNTLGSIAREKAGIIKSRIPVVSGVSQSEPRGVIRHCAADQQAPLVEVDRDYRTDVTGSHDGGRLRFDYHGHAGLALTDLELAMLGRHQVANAGVALATIECLRAQDWSISDTAIRAGLATATLPARVEVHAGPPRVVLDSAHNEPSALALVATLDECFGAGPRTLIAACSKDKDVAAIARALAPGFDRVVATRYLENPRAMPPAELAHEFRACGVPNVTTSDTPREAWDMALAAARPSELVCISGSFFLAAELRELVIGLGSA